MKTILLLALLLASADGSPERVSIPLDDSPALGPPGAAVTIIEFIDFQ